MKSNLERATVTADQIPPYCYRLPGMTAEEGAAVAVKEMRVSTPCDVLAVLWELRRVTANEQTEVAAAACASSQAKTQTGADEQ